MRGFRFTAMDLRFLDQSSPITPILVRLYEQQKLCDAAGGKSPMARVEFTNSITDILDMKASPRETEMIADVLIDLIRQAEVDIRQAVAQKLAAMKSVPLRLVLQLTNDDIAVAAPVLEQSPVLDDLDLIYIVKSQGPRYWQRIAARKRLNEQVINILADTGDLDTAIALVENTNIKLTEHAITALSDLAQGHDNLALPLVRREEVGREVAEQLYRFVGEQVKAYIKENFDIDPKHVEDAVEEVVLDLTDSDAAKEIKAPSKPVTIGVMISTLRRGQIKTFVKQFSQHTGLDEGTVRKTLEQKSGQGLAVACKAFDILKDDFVSIYLLTNRARSAGKMIDLKDMTKAIGYYNRITQEVARDIMSKSTRH